MSQLGILAVVLISAWLGILSVVIALLVRQVALLTYRVDPDYALDGLAVGRRIPSSISKLLPEGSGSVLVLGVGCGACRELVDGLRGHVIDEPLVAIIEGDELLAQTLVEALPENIQTLTGQSAEHAYSALGLQTTPFMFSVEHRKILRKDVLRGLRHFLSLLPQSLAASTAWRPEAILEGSNA
ncbi:MAG: hypothetical protein ACJ75S_02600 [Solirubrobacterales bacterium]